MRAQEVCDKTAASVSVGRAWILQISIFRFRQMLCSSLNAVIKFILGIISV